jgi:predicted metal-dependent hydrolase
LWNAGLYFELHELLETIWLDAPEPERSALKGWIQAAGACVHYQRGKPDAALGLAARARTYLRAGSTALAFIANLEEFIDALEDLSQLAAVKLVDKAPEGS